MMMTLSRGWVRGAVWLMVVMLGSVVARSQEVSGSISGTVVDPSGASVNGAEVTVTNTDRGVVQRHVTTNKTGFYSAPSLPLGNYTVTIGAKGFKNASVTGLVLNANDQLKVDQKLAVGAASETVTITANQAPINLENGMSEGLVTGNQVRELVLNNRNYEQLLTLQPGVAYGGASDQLYIGVSLPAGTSNQVAFSVNGQRPTANNWTLDGADNVDRGANLTLLTFPSVDAIAEFNTLRGTYKAEYGRNSSSQVNVVTRSGSNDIHGTVYEFFRNDLFNANNYFSNLTRTARPKLRYNDFGFAIGGPVYIPHLYNGRTRKTFFFYSQEFRRVVNYSAVNALVPTADERAGKFTNSYLGGSSASTAPVAVCTSYTLATGSCNAYGTSVAQIDPTAQAYLDNIYSSVPLPNSAADLAAGLDPHTISYNARNVFNDTQEFARVDQAFGTRVNMFYRYLHDSLPSTEAGGLFVGGGMPGVQTTNTTAPGTQHLGHITISVRPSLLVDMGYAYSSGAVLSDPVGLAHTALTAKNPVNPTLPYTSTLGIVPSVSFVQGSGSGSAPTGIANAGTYRDYDTNHNGFGDLTYTIRQHTLKFGISYNHYQKIENALGNGSPYPQGLFAFGNPATPNAAQLSGVGAGTVAPSNFDAAWANFLIGNASGGGSSSGFQQASVAATPNLNENLVELYAQDDWRLTRRLTVNLGVRYSYFGQPYDVNNELSNFNPATFTAANAQTIDSNGLLCTTASQQTVVQSGTSSATYNTNCLNANGLNNYTPNAIADPLNGMILGNPNPVAAFKETANAPSPQTHGSPFGLEVGHAEKRDWAPRVGFALDVFGDGKTALRGGYGIAYDQSPVSIYEQAIFNNVPYVSTVSFPSVRFNGTGGITPLANLTPPSLRATPVNYQTPYVQQFSIDIQQVISPTTTLDIGYFGDHGTHLQGVVDINQAYPGSFNQAGIAFNGAGFRPVVLQPIASTGASYNSTGGASQAGLNVFNIPNCPNGFTSSSCELPLNQVRPYPGYNAINAVETIFNSNYNSLQVKFTKRFSGKSLFDANYTFEKGLTNAQSDYSSAPQNSYNIEPEYGRSAYDRHDILTVDAIWELPWMRDQRGLMGHALGGWEVSGLYSLNAGLPLTATASGGTTVNYSGYTSLYNSALTNGGVVNDAAGLGILGPSAAGLRPNQVSNPNFGYGIVPVHSRQAWFNPTSFVAPPPTSFQVGNERRSVINGPGFNRMDIGLFRNFRLYKESFFQLRGEAFNVLNHTNWAGVCTNVAGSGCAPYAFGAVTSARDPRILQVAGKINF
jgi:hypothetical protein